MSVTEFLPYLVGRDTSRELAVQLVEVYRMSTRDHRTTTACSGATILDLGCRVGRIGAELSVRGHYVDGVDESLEMLAHARERIAEVVEARIEDLKLGRRFDVVLLASHLINTGSRA